MGRSWDIETDVVVVGYGLAGGVAAVTARDAGAEVIILEKGQYPGGCSIFSGGAIKCVEDVEEAVRYLTAISGGRMESETIRAFAEALAGNEAFARKLAEVNGAIVRRIPGGMGVYPYPGQGTWYSVRIHQIPGFEGFPWMRNFLTRAGVNLIKLIMDNVEARGIEARLATPARRLVLNEEGVVIGVIAETKGQQIAIRTRRAAILATGGFEQNDWLRKQSLQGVPFFSMAPLTHTGDGVTMAQKVGAAVWHMWHVHGSYGFKTPDSPIAYRTTLSGPRNPKRKVPWVVVDRLGTRYMNEYPPAPQDTAHRAMEIFDPDLPGFPRIPSLIVFDEAGRKRGPIAEPLAFPGYEYNWSEDNSAEVDNGWILRAETIAQLAAAIRKGFPENENLMDGERLSRTIAGWNAIVAAGNDPLGRPVGTMMPITQSPFYAALVWPIITNTQGGPVHNARQQVVDPFGQPIPRLYSVGELGSFFGHLYELGGNLGECMTSGRIAGQHAGSESLM